MNKRQKKKQLRKRTGYKDAEKIADEIMKAYGIECGKHREIHQKNVGASDYYLKSVEKAWETFLTDKQNKAQNEEA